MNDLQEQLAQIPLEDYDARMAVVYAHSAREKALDTDRNATVLARLYATWFEGVVGIFIDPTIQSQEIAKDGTILLGTGYGHYRPCAANFTFHELGHFLEIDTRRMGKRNWGLRFPKSTWYSRGSYGMAQEFHPKTPRGLIRELRVIAIQDVLTEHFDPEGSVKTGRSLIEDNTLLDQDALGAWLAPGKGREGKQKWCLRQYAKFRRQYTFEGLYAEWLRRTAILKRRMQARARRAGKVTLFIEA